MEATVPKIQFGHFFILCKRWKMVGYPKSGCVGLLFLSFMFVPGSLHWRARNMVLGSVLGAVFCFPLGWIHLKLVEKAHEGNPAANPDLNQRREASGVSAAIERLKGNLSE